MKIGFIGLKGINLWMCRPAIEQHPRAELAAGCDPDGEVAQRFHDNYGIPVYASLAEMVEAADLDGVMIGTPNHIHPINIREAAEAGLNMCVTKPITNTVADAIEAIDVCRKAGVVLATGHEYRFRPVVRALLKRAVAGEIGKVSFAEAHMGHLGGLGKLTDSTNWRSNKANVPGGCANMLGTHCFDALNAALGRPIAVTAEFRKLLSPSPLEDTTVSIVEYENGALGCATSSYCSAHSDYVRVNGTEGNLLAHTRAEKLFLEREGKFAELEIEDHPPSGYAVIDMFVRAVEDGETPETGGPEGLASVAVLEASIRSSEEGRRVRIDELARER